MSEQENYSGGCQCGSVRYRVSGLSGAGICHCRMCQKAFAAPYAALVSVETLEWTRGAPAYFQSSNLVKRGFCAACGTPLTYEVDGGNRDVSILSMDDPSVAEPKMQLAREQMVPWCESTAELGVRPPEEQVKVDAFLASIESNQHPDHDTDQWPQMKDLGE